LSVTAGITAAAAAAGGVIELIPAAVADAADDTAKLDR